MIVKSYLIDDSLHLKEESPEQKIGERLADGKPRWIDIVDPDKRELREILSPLISDESIIEDFILRGRNLPLAHTENELYFEFPRITEEATFEIEHISFLCMRNLLITIHAGEIDPITKLASDLCNNFHLQRATIASLLYHIIENMMETNYFLYINQRDSIHNLGKSINLAPDEVDLKSILTLKNNIGRLSVMAEDQLYCLNAIQKFEGAAFDIGKQRRNFKKLDDEAQNEFRLLGRYESRLQNIHQHYDLTLQERTNNRLKVLTIIAAIFLPLNLIAGIYGMNFRYIPLLQWQYSYHLTLILMLAVSAGMLFFFYRSGWFK
ncbi:MAG: magnesium transporter CorA family protein [Deltaproteobacteria bacterium]